MKVAVLLLSICLVMCLASAIENNTGRRLVNPPIWILELREKRSSNEGVKGGHPLFQFPKQKPGLFPTKGEYVCGDKICKLEPGVIPKNCNGICQYPIL